jgi:hypothetical protein
MSRGLGKIQRQLLALLSETPMTLSDAACAIFCNPCPSRSQYETVRRAFGKLQGHALFAKRGTVARSRLWAANGSSKIQVGRSALGVTNVA